MREDIYKHFDKVEVYEPDYDHISKWISLPRKVVYINQAAMADAKIIRIGWDADDELFQLPFEN